MIIKKQTVLLRSVHAGAVVTVAVRAKVLLVDWSSLHHDTRHVERSLLSWLKFW